MATQTASDVTVQIRLTREQYERLCVEAQRENRSVEQVIPRIALLQLDRHDRARALLNEVSESYNRRLAAEGKLDQTPGEVLEELRQIREQVFDELYSK